MDSVESRTDTSPQNELKRKRSDAGSLVDDSGRERHQCPQCHRSFGRIEHMKRHAASHSNDRPYKCSICDKGFYRVDTMQRHELIHRDETESAKPKGARACSECANAKVRCSGGLPCQRCEGRDAECRYPEGRNASDDAESVTDGQMPAQTTHHNEAEPGEQSRPQVARTNTLASLPFSPGIWDHNAASPSQWYPRNTSVEFPVSPDYPKEQIVQRQPSISNQQLHPMGTNSYADSCSSLRQAGFVTGTVNPSVGTPSTRHWLDTLIEPNVAVESDGGTPNTAGSPKTVGSGEFYVDGHGARLPKVGAHRRFSSRASLPLPSPGLFSSPQTDLRSRYGFPAMASYANPQKTTGSRRVLDDHVYNEMHRHFIRVCTHDSAFGSAFDSPNFPSWDNMQSYICNYLDEFQPLIPMLHLPTLDLASAHWVLALALASIGSQSARTPDAEHCTLALHEFLRRAISVLTDAGDDELAPVLFAQARLLSCIGMMYCGDEKLAKYAQRSHSELTRFCVTQWAFEDNPFKRSGDSNSDIVELDWQRWKDVEMRRRTGYGIWIMDCMWAYQFQERPLLKIEDATVPLPCQEVLWEAESALQWHHVREFSVPSPSLLTASQLIYIEKRVEPTLGEFSRILLIHALYQRKWEVQSHLSNPMSHWAPTAERQELANYTREPIWLLSNQSYVRWRNAACDCLDILHWRANSVIGAASGVEHPTLLHLHLARIVLLTPIRNIHDLAFGITKEDPNMTEAQMLHNLNIVRRWAQEDGFKIRLAMYHAGVLFWHVRLYSARGFYEPSAVLLAALALWAYGTFTQKSTLPNGMLYDSVGMEDDSSFPTSINLDRPADDELVQSFILRGDRMQALITGVGDIRSEQGPQRMLLQGAKLTSSLTTWGCSRKVIRVLTNLAHHCQQNSLVSPMDHFPRPMPTIDEARLTRLSTSG